MNCVLKVYKSYQKIGKKTHSKVDFVSSPAATVIVAMIKDLAFPPKALWSNLVKLESL